MTGGAANAVFGELGRRSSAPSWNFNRYPVSAGGRLVRHFDSRVKPESAELPLSIEQLLN